MSAFYAECPDKRICANYSVWTKSKFLGISVGVDMVGVGKSSLIVLSRILDAVKLLIEYPDPEFGVSLY